MSLLIRRFIQSWKIPIPLESVVNFCRWFPVKRFKGKFWQFIVKKNCTHVFPVGDIWEHKTGENGFCECKPSLEFGKLGRKIYIHNCLDGRNKKNV